MSDTKKLPLVSVIIPTYNRFSLLRAAVQSVMEQTYSKIGGDIEIIIVNDASTDAEYYRERIFGVSMVHLKTNTRDMFGFPCAGYVRNVGASIATGDYLAFLDDDDVWLPKKLELQMEAMLHTIAATPSTMKVPRLSCTEGFITRATWNYLLGAPSPEIAAETGLQLYNGEHYYDTLCNIYETAGAEARHAAYDANNIEVFDLRHGGFPTVWNYNFLKIHNCVITSSVVMSRDFFEKLGGFREYQNGEEDYDLWRRATKKGGVFISVKAPCFLSLLRGF